MKKNNTVLTIFKKELFRFFKDKRTMSAIMIIQITSATLAMPPVIFLQSFISVFLI